jgi:alkylation response protein AidB-like acyl-CoA dehydrogenase
MEGFKIRRMPTQGWWISGTAHLTFEDVKVPVKNLIGKENLGFMSIMYNFNHERFGLAASANRYSVPSRRSLFLGRAARA